MTFSMLVLGIQRSADLVYCFFRIFLQCCHHVFVVSFFRHEMQHFVHNLEGYLSNQILNVTWSEFQEGLLNVGDLGMI